MIPLAKLAKLSPNHRLRKAALVLGEVERSLMAADSGEGAERLKRYAREMAALLEGAGSEGPPALKAARALRDASENSFLRALDALRHELLSLTGQAPADWDLIDPTTGRPDPLSRKIREGTKAYLEDLRSPFNVGTIFRTAEAFGIEELLLSPSCADPRHPRAERSAMGAVDLVPWRRIDLAELRTIHEGCIFALELGGTPLQEFSFPRKGIIVIGSEELGVSPEAKELCSGRIVSIPMQGAKASLNAAVAFGIAVHAWTYSML